jgi:hypothetical protein
MTIREVVTQANAARWCRWMAGGMHLNWACRQKHMGMRTIPMSNDSRAVRYPD